MPCFCAKIAMMPRWSSVAAPAESSTSNQSSHVLPVRRATASVLTPAASLMLLRAGRLAGAGASVTGAALTGAALTGAALTGAALTGAAFVALALLGAALAAMGLSAAALT